VVWFVGDYLDKRWKNFVAIVVAIGILVVITDVFVMPTQNSTTNNTFKGLQAIWQAYGIKANYLSDAYDKLDNLSTDDLASLKAKIDAFQNQSTVMWLKDIASIYSTEIGIELTKRKLSSLQQKIESLHNPCDNLSLF